MYKEPEMILLFIPVRTQLRYYGPQILHCPVRKELEPGYPAPQLLRDHVFDSRESRRSSSLAVQR